MVVDLIFALGLPVWLCVEELMRLRSERSPAQARAEERIQQHMLERLEPLVEPLHHVSEAASTRQDAADRELAAIR
jgi:hypothetical protein